MVGNVRSGVCQPRWPVCIFAGRPKNESPHALTCENGACLGADGDCLDFRYTPTSGFRPFGVVLSLTSAFWLVTGLVFSVWIFIAAAYLFSAVLLGCAPANALAALVMRFSFCGFGTRPSGRRRRR